MRTLVLVLLNFGLAAGAAWAQAPTTVIHIIHVKWKVEATPEQVKAAVDAVQQLPAKYPGIKRVWTKNLRYQGQEGFKQAIVMEFESQDSLKNTKEARPRSGGMSYTCRCGRIAARMILPTRRSPS